MKSLYNYDDWLTVDYRFSLISISSNVGSIKFCFGNNTWSYAGLYRILTWWPAYFLNTRSYFFLNTPLCQQPLCFVIFFLLYRKDASIHIVLGRPCNFRSISFTWAYSKTASPSHSSIFCLYLIVFKMRNRNHRAAIIIAIPLRIVSWNTLSGYLRSMPLNA